MSDPQADLDKIDAAIASGHLTVKYEDREVTYRSMSDLFMARAHVARRAGRVVETFCNPTFDKGV